MREREKQNKTKKQKKTKQKTKQKKQNKHGGYPNAYIKKHLIKYSTKPNTKEKTVNCIRCSIKYHNLFNNDKHVNYNFRSKNSNIREIKLCHDTDKKLKTLLETARRLYYKTEIYMTNKKRDPVSLNNINVITATRIYTGLPGQVVSDYQTYNSITKLYSKEEHPY